MGIPNSNLCLPDPEAVGHLSGETRSNDSTEDQSSVCRPTATPSTCPGLSYDDPICISDDEGQPVSSATNSRPMPLRISGVGAGIPGFTSPDSVHIDTSDHIHSDRDSDSDDDYQPSEDRGDSESDIEYPRPTTRLQRHRHDQYSQLPGLSTESPRFLSPSRSLGIPNPLSPHSAFPSTISLSTRKREINNSRKKKKSAAATSAQSKPMPQINQKLPNAESGVKNRAKNYEKKRKSQAERRRRKLDETRKKAILAAGLDSSAFNDKDITIIRCKRNPELRERMKGQRFNHDDPIFSETKFDWKRIGGRGTGRVYVLDEDTDELVFACHIHHHEDMPTGEKRMFQNIFDYFEQDRKFHRKCQVNGAHCKGTMVAIGWRKAMVQEEAFATYSPKHAGTPEFIQHSCHKAAEIHRIYSSRFKKLAPALHLQQVSQHAALGLPAVGFGNEDNLVGEEVFCSNLAYTRDGFENKGHCDHDISTYTFGIGGNVRTDSKMASFKQGYHQRGAFFYVADYALIIDYSRIDGVVEQIWQGPNHVHATVGGFIKEGFTRIGSTCQINRRLARAVASYLATKPEERRFVVDDVGRFFMTRL